MASLRSTGPLRSIMPFNHRRLLNDRNLMALSLALLVLVIVHQVALALARHPDAIPLRSEDEGSTLGLLAFVGLSISLVLLSSRIVKIPRGLTLFLIIVGINLALASTSALTIGIDWSGNDVPRDSFYLALEVQEQGPVEFIRTYNDRGNPGLSGSSVYAGRVYELVRLFRLEDLAEAKWRGGIDTSLGRPHMHPPLFFLILGGWLHLHGNTAFAATVFMWLSVAIWGLICFALLEAIDSEASVLLTLLFATLPTTIVFTWFPTYDVLSGVCLFAGYGLLVLAVRKPHSWFPFPSGLLLGASAMFRLTSLFLVASASFVLAYLALRGRYPINGLLLYTSGLLVFPIVLLWAGYDPILTLLTGTVRQSIYYETLSTPIVFRLGGLPYLGIPLIVLVAFEVLRLGRGLVTDTSGLMLLIPISASLPIAVVTRLTPDFPRNMIGISSCLVLALALFKNWPKSTRSQSLLIGVNLAFVALVMAI